MPSFPHTFKWPFVLDTFLDQSTLALSFLLLFHFSRVTVHFSEPTALPRHKRSFSNRSLDINSMRVFFVGSSERVYLTFPGIDLLIAYPIPGRFGLFMHFLSRSLWPTSFLHIQSQVALAYLCISFLGRFGLLLCISNPRSLLPTYAFPFPGRFGLLMQFLFRVALTYFLHFLLNFFSLHF